MMSDVEMKKYQDYVIKDGEFVGEFEKMYQDFDDPWHQSKEQIYVSMSRRAVCYFLDHFNIKSIVEFGCGLGRTSNFIHENTGVDILGIDISETSIKKSRENYPHLTFEVDNILNISNYSDYQCMFFSEITWYMLEGKMIDKVFNNMSQGLGGKYFIHNLVFYKDSSQEYGRDYFTSLDEFIDFCPFDLLGKVEVDLADDNVTVETSAIFRI